MPVLEATITTVTVYTQRARITRRGSIRLEPGEHTLIIDNLPDTLEDESVRVSGTGAGVTLLGVDVKTEYVKEEPRESVAELKKQLETLEAEKQTLTDEETILNVQMEFLIKFGEHSGEKYATASAAGDISLQKVTELNTYLAAQAGGLSTRQREIKTRKTV